MVQEISLAGSSKQELPLILETPFLALSGTRTFVFISAGKKKKTTADRAELNLLTPPQQGENTDSSETHMVGFTQISPNLGRKSVFLVHLPPAAHTKQSQGQH